MVHKDLKNLPAYHIPLVKNWHAKTELKPEKGKTLANFGLNWFDLYYAKRLGVKDKITLKYIPNISTYVMINMGSDFLNVRDNSTDTFYRIPPGARANLDNYKRNNQLVVLDNKDSCYIHQTIVYDVVLILFNIQEITKTSIKHTALFKDFFLMSGVPNVVQYMSTTGILSLEQYEIEGQQIEETSETKSEWASFLIDQWKTINPGNAKVLPKKDQIPKKIHWIWLSRVPGTPNPLKPRFVKFMASWIERNPNCEFNVWTDSSDPKIPSKLKDYITVRYSDDIERLFQKLPNKIAKGIRYIIKNHPNVGVRADTLRQVILYLIGGVYADINDMSCLASIEGMLERLDFMIGVEPVIYVNNAFVASKKGHIIPKNFVIYISNMAKEFVDIWVDEADDMEREEKDNLVVSETGPIAMTSIIFALIDEKNKLKHSCIFPSSWIYPNYGITDRPNMWLKPISITSHFDARDYLK